MVGSQPNDEHINRQNGMREQRGMLNGNHLTMVSQTKRIDWTLDPARQGSLEPTVPPELPAIGPVSCDTLEPFATIVRKWLIQCPPVNRLAFGAILVMPVANAQKGCEELQKHLHYIQMNPQNTTDFIYQINRPKESAIDSGVRINRLCRWSVSQIGTVGVEVDLTTLNASAAMEGQYVCKLDLDINTAVLNNVVSGDNAYEIFQELVAHGQEIAAKGDIQ